MSINSEDTDRWKMNPKDIKAGLEPKLDPQGTPVYLQVAAENIPGKFTKGDVVEIYAKGTERSEWIELPRWLWITIVDRSKFGVNKYLENWPTKFDYDLVNESNDGWRFDMIVDPDYVSLSNLNKSELKLDIRNAVEEDAKNPGSLFYAISIVSWTSTSMRVDVPKPVYDHPAYEGTDPNWIDKYVSDYASFLKDLKDYTNDKFETVFNVRRWYFREQAVDQIISENGEWTGFSAEAENYLRDKLDD